MILPEMFPQTIKKLNQKDNSEYDIELKLITQEVDDDFYRSISTQETYDSNFQNTVQKVKEKQLKSQYNAVVYQNALRIKKLEELKNLRDSLSMGGNGVFRKQSPPKQDFFHLTVPILSSPKHSPEQPPKVKRLITEQQKIQRQHILEQETTQRLKKLKERSLYRVTNVLSRIEQLNQANLRISKYIEDIKSVKSKAENHFVSSQMEVNQFKKETDLKRVKSETQIYSKRLISSSLNQRIESHLRDLTHVSLSQKVTFYIEIQLKEGKIISKGLKQHNYIRQTQQ